METTSLYKLLSLKELAIAFHKNKIVELKETQLSSGKKSPYYMDMRGLLAFPELMTDITERLADRILMNGVAFDKFASVPVGAVPFASQLAGKMGRASVLVRDTPKQHGTKKLIEGRLAIDDRVILVEDVITTGASVIKTIQKLKNRGAEVVAVWALLNREEGGLENIAYEYKDIPVYSLFTTTDIFGPLVKDKVIAAYDWERIKFFQESQYKDMIRTLREKNTAKKEPEWQTNRAQYFATRFPHWIALQPQTPSNLILSLAKPGINLNPNQITHILAKNRVPVPLIHTNGLNISSENLEKWHRETGGRVILDTGAMLGWQNNTLMPNLDKMTPETPGIRYEVAGNHILISSVADIDAAINNLREHNDGSQQNHQRNKFIILSFNHTQANELVNNDAIWKSLDKLVLAMTNNNLGCCGLALKYSDMCHLTCRKDLWMRAPVCLWIDKWHLHPSMVSVEGVSVDFHKSWAEMTQVIDHVRPWQIVMDEDTISGLLPVIDRIGQYSQFFNADQITGLINDIRRNIYNLTDNNKQATSNNSLTDTQQEAFNYFKTTARLLAKVREEPLQPATQNNAGNIANPSGIMSKAIGINANELCQCVYNMCKDGVVWGYTFATDLIAAQKQISAQRRQIITGNNTHTIKKAELKINTKLGGEKLC
jgi:orotate phosphoribosyltransferase